MFPHPAPCFPPSPAVAVPVRRVKPEARVPLGADGEFQFQWDPTDEEADPSAHFPYGT